MVIFGSQASSNIRSTRRPEFEADSTKAYVTTATSYASRHARSNLKRETVSTQEMNINDTLVRVREVGVDGDA